jgi:hypothetical protein
LIFLFPFGHQFTFGHFFIRLFVDASKGVSEFIEGLLGEDFTFGFGFEGLGEFLSRSHFLCGFVSERVVNARVSLVNVVEGFTLGLGFEFLF